MRSLVAAKQMRWGGVVLLVAGLAVIHYHFPTLPPESWQTVHSFHLDGEECRALREQRQIIDFDIPSAVGATVTVGEVAKKFNLELPLVCGANDRSDCGDDALTPGVDSLILPLYRDAPAVSREEP